MLSVQSLELVDALAFDLVSVLELESDFDFGFESFFDSDFESGLDSAEVFCEVSGVFESVA